MLEVSNISIFLMIWVNKNFYIHLMYLDYMVIMVTNVAFTGTTEIRVLGPNAD